MGEKLWRQVIKVALEHVELQTRQRAPNENKSTSAGFSEKPSLRSSLVCVVFVRLFPWDQCVEGKVKSKIG